MQRIFRVLALFVQGETGAWPAVWAVLDPDVSGGQLWGPPVFGLRGRPRAELVAGHLADALLGIRLWDASRDLWTSIRPSF
ncbi:hypothetical protein ACFVH6_08525 [Spirillospora sp. NPDC127200]